ncbi:hypothetical protein Nepgr_028713 [Nepenthes gracilis]|uniref:Uncharacterized protein n=1 Tax=Nepenthes gracilis TaxID=150966 RepID=A0AAD3TAW7_NEPGR|nr:hypothetical protein Nepgr_028713 [Nepenthes gracilis]
MELCSKALEEMVTTAAAQILLIKAALKFQEVVALAFLNWGNVHICTARKRIPLEETARQEAYEWVKEKYSMAKEKYEEMLVIKPDFYKGLLARGQQQFEMAILQWTYASCKENGLSSWDSMDTMKLFDSAAEKTRAATEMLKKLRGKEREQAENPDNQEGRIAKE